MANLNPGSGTAPLYLEDLRVGQRFVSGTHRIDEEQIRAFAGAVRPPAVSPRRGGREGDVLWRTRGERLAHGSDHHAAARGERLAHRRRDHRGRRRDHLAQARCGRATCSRSRARSSSSGRRGRVRTVASQPSGARLATSVATPCRCSSPSSSCRVQHRVRPRAPRLLLKRLALTRASPARPAYRVLFFPRVRVP